MKNKILALTILAFTSMNAMAQEEVNVTGKVVDKVGNPVSGAAVSVLVLRFLNNLVLIRKQY